jgi:mevalonate kinase
MMSIPLVARAPAKIILTGEHSVVYGKQAIVTAVNKYAYTEVLPCSSDTISFNLHDLKHKAFSTLRTLRILKERIMESYHLCLSGKLTIRQVLQKPAELFQFALISLIDTFQMELQKGLNIHLSSEIPIGCGMGSSAATVVSVISALSSFFKIDINPEWLFKLSMEAERLQHGYSSGVDAYICLNGGCVRFQQGHAQAITLPQMSLYLVNTGKPETTTGECVMAVSKDFKTSDIWSEFEMVANLLEKALYSQSLDDIKEIIKMNHTLLCSIGVVPQQVQAFIQDIENNGGAAKICGAGAVKGQSAGVVMVISNTKPLHLVEKYGFTLSEVKGESQGAHLM